MLRIKNLCIILIVPFVLFCLSSCDFYVDIDKKYNGLSIGFYYENDYNMNSLVGAVRSNQTEFNINDITLDLFYGWYFHPPIYFSLTDIYEPVCVALYFFKSSWKYEFDDYQNIENAYLLKEISIKEFSTEAYSVKMTKQEGKIFEQHSIFTIPQELFVGSKGSIYFVVANITWDPKKELNQMHRIGFRRIAYRYIDEETVHLYK